MMSDYHGLETSDKMNRIRIAIHANTPNGTNAVGYAYQTAVQDYFTTTAPDGTTQVPPTSAVPWLQATNPTEYAAIQSGDVLETVEWVDYDANASNAEKLAAMNAYVAIRIPEIIQAMTDRLMFWGADRTLS